MMKLLWIVAVVALAVLLAGWAYHAQSGRNGVVFSQSKMEILRADGSKAPFAIEIAETHEQQERGLMFRKKLAPNAGMLFLWPEDQPVSMWMKNTFIPLDMLFVAHDGRIVKITANAAPLDLTTLSSDGAVRAVIEIGGGEAARQNLKTGDKVLFSAFE
jgi:uncharacterized protein